MEEVLGYASLGFREKVWDGDINFIIIRTKMASKSTEKIWLLWRESFTEEPSVEQDMNNVLLAMQSDSRI